MRLYIDSRHRNGGTSDSDFSVMLSKTLEFAPDSKAVIEAVVLSNTWESCILGVNQKLYVRQSTGGVISDQVLTLTAGSYTPTMLAQEELS